MEAMNRQLPAGGAELSPLEDFLTSAVVATYMILGEGPGESWEFQDLPETCEFYLLLIPKSCFLHT